MIYALIPLGIIIICLIVIGFIIGKKLPQITTLDVTGTPESRADLVKDKIVHERLMRSLTAISNKAVKFFSPGFKASKKVFTSLYDKVSELERKSRKKIQPRTPEEKEKVEKKIEEFLAAAEALAETENWKEAEGKYIDAIGLDPKNVEAYRGLADLYFMKGDLAKAKETFEYIIKLNSQDFDSYSHLGQIMAQQKDFKKAKEYQLKSVELDNQAALHYVDLAWTLRELGELKEAFEAAEKAVGLEPNNPRNLDLLAELSIMTGNKKAAGEAVDKLREVNPENEKIEKLEEQIRKI